MARSSPSPLLLLGLGVAVLTAVVMRRKEAGALMRSLPPPDIDKSRKISDLHPQFQPIVKEWERRVRAAGIDAYIFFTYRSPQEQQRLKAAGSSTLDFGYHNAGLAIDFNVTLPGRKPFFPDESTPIDQLAEWADLMTRAGEIGEDLGMRWGGRFSDGWVGKKLGRRFGWDPFHLEWHPGLTLASVQQKQAQEGYAFTIAA